MINSKCNTNTVAGIVLAVPVIASMLFVADYAAADPPATIQLTGMVRDFKERTATGGHTDFERRPDKGFGHYAGNVDIFLGEDGKPRFNGGGYKINSQWKDDQGRPIAPHLYNQQFGTSSLVSNSSLNDHPGSSGASSTGGIESSSSFDEWFNDVPGVNLSTPLTLTFVQQTDGTYVFDDSLDSAYDNLGGFFPIEGNLFGNPGGNPDRNFHFTFELHTEFTYVENDNQVFRFTGDDDVWVFIDGKLAIDLGGVHAATDQFIDLSRMNLQDGETYTLDFFFAERHRTQSNFRIVTNIELQTANLPPVFAAFD